MGLEGVLQGPPEELPAGPEQERLAPVDDLTGRGGAGGGLQFLGQGQGPFDDQPLERGHGIEGGAVMGASGMGSIRSPVVNPDRTECQNPLAHSRGDAAPSSRTAGDTPGPGVGRSE